VVTRVYIDVSIVCAECHLTFYRAIEAKENDKHEKYKGEVEKLPNCTSVIFVIGSNGGFGPCTLKVWNRSAQNTCQESPGPRLAALVKITIFLLTLAPVPFCEADAAQCG
jgi:hypothetical protein